MACIRLFVKPNICQMFLYNLWRYDIALANNIFMQQVLVFFWCQNDLLVDYYNACWWALSQ